MTLATLSLVALSSAQLGGTMRSWPGAAGFVVHAQAEAAFTGGARQLGRGAAARPTGPADASGDTGTAVLMMGGARRLLLAAPAAAAEEALEEAANGFSGGARRVGRNLSLPPTAKPVVAD